MSAVSERAIRIRGISHRVLEAGEGPRVGFLAGLGGLPGWTPFLERLSRAHRVVAPSLPGFPGATGHDRLDTLTDWIATTLDVLEAVDVAGCDLVGASVGATLAAEAAICSPAVAKRLVLIAPFGLFDSTDPVSDPFAVMPGALDHLACDAARIRARFAPPAGADPVEAQVEQLRASEAAARILWPTTDTGIAGRLHRIRVPTLLLWGEADALIPPSYAKRFAAGIGASSEVRMLAGAGHLAELDAPEACADSIAHFLARSLTAS